LRRDRHRLRRGGGHSPWPANHRGHPSHPDRAVDDATFAGGQLFVLCGIDGLGELYRTETLVSTDFNGDLYAINAVYWSNADLAVSQDTGSPTGGEGIVCPER
jgi:hypothetical protein